MEKINIINGNSFLANVFVQLIDRKRIQVTMDQLVAVEYNYLEGLDQSKNNVLENSIQNIIDFVRSYEGYLSFDEEGRIINISMEEELREILIEEYSLGEQPKEEPKNYKKAVKKLVNQDKKARKSA